MGEQLHSRKLVSYKSSEPDHKFISVLLSTLELNKLCREYDTSVVYALSGIPFLLMLTAEGIWQTKIEDEWNMISPVEDLLYNLKIKFEIFSGLSGVYNDEYFQSRIYEHLYLRMPIIARLCTSREWVQINNLDRSGKTLTIRHSSGITEELGDWYPKLDYVVLYIYPTQTYVFDPDWICRAIRQQVLSRIEVSQQTLADRESKYLIKREILWESLKILSIHKKFALQFIVKLAQYRKGFQETIDSYRRVIKEIQICHQVLKETSEDATVLSFLSVLLSIEKEALSSLIHWLDVYIPLGTWL